MWRKGNDGRAGGSPGWKPKDPGIDLTGWIKSRKLAEYDPTPLSAAHMEGRIRAAVCLPGSKEKQIPDRVCVLIPERLAQ